MEIPRVEDQQQGGSRPSCESTGGGAKFLGKTTSPAQGFWVLEEGASVG